MEERIDQMGKLLGKGLYDIRSPDRQEHVDAEQINKSESLVFAIRHKNRIETPAPKRVG